MKNNNINMNREPLTEADITRGKNFNQVLKEYHAMKTPFLKTKKFWIGASSILAAAAATLIIYSKIAGFDGTNPPTSFIAPPVAQGDIKPTNYVVNTATDTTIHHTTGSLIHVPANAFRDKKGNLVTGKVDISYREFNKTSEVFLSGIPMTYDSAGEQYHFETAGMMEINASQNGEALQPNPEALITVDIVSANKEDRFNTYYLDTIEKKWKYLAQTNYIDTATLTGSTNALDTALNDSSPLTEIKKEIAKIEKSKPVEPKKIDATRQRFTIKVDENEFPEIAVYKSVKFEPIDNSYDANKADILWEKVEMARIPGRPDQYKITFSRYGETYTLTAKPVFADKDYTEAKKIYDEKYAEYQSKLAKRKADEAQLKADMGAKAKEYEAEIQKQMAIYESRRKEYEARLQQSDLVYRTFQVSNFGVWNCDCPSRLPQGENLAASLIDAKTKKPLIIQYCYLVEKGRNVMFTYYPNSLTGFRFDKKADNMVWAVTNDLKVAVLSTEAFKASKVTGKQIELELNVIDKKFTSSDDVKEYLEI